MLHTHSKNVLLPRRNGLTLLEMTLAVFVAAILMTGMGSAIYIALQSLEETTSPTVTVADGSTAADQLHGEIRHALRMTERTPTSVAFTVPDRSGEGVPETIRYAFSGTPGDPLTRSYNNQTPTTVVENVQHFALAYPERDMPGSGPPALISLTDLEAEQMSHDDAPGGVFETITINGSQHAAQYFRPDLPADAISWSLTGLHLSLKHEGLVEGQMTVQIRKADANQQPGPDVLSEVDLLELNLLDLLTWTSVSLPDVNGLLPGEGLTVVVFDSGLGSAGNVEYERDGNPMTPDAHFMISNDDGATWSAPNDTHDMRFVVVGTVTREVVP